LTFLTQPTIILSLNRLSFFYSRSQCK